MGDVVPFGKGVPLSKQCGALIPNPRLTAWCGKPKDHDGNHWSAKYGGIEWEGLTDDQYDF